MAVVGEVAVLVVDVVDVVAVGHRFVPASVPVVMGVVVVRGVGPGHALVPVVVVAPVGMAVMEIIGVVVMGDRGVAASVPVAVVVFGVSLVVGDGHRCVLSAEWVTASFTMWATCSSLSS